MKDAPREETPHEEALPPTATPNSPTSVRRVRIAEQQQPVSNIPATTVSFRYCLFMQYLYPSTAESIQALPKPELRSPNTTRRRPAKSGIVSYI